VIDVLPVDYRVGDEVMVEGVYTPVEAREGQTVAVRVVLRATRRSAGELLVKHDGRVLDLNGPDTPGLGDRRRPLRAGPAGGRAHRRCGGQPV